MHGHGQIQVWRHGCRSHSDAVLIADVQMMSDVQSGGQCGCSCESQQALHSQALSQHLDTVFCLLLTEIFEVLLYLVVIYDGVFGPNKDIFLLLLRE